MNTYKAVVLGASGSVGAALVQELLNSPRCALVTALVRKESLPKNDRLREHVINMDRMGDEAEKILADHEFAFCTIGVTEPNKVLVSIVHAMWGYGVLPINLEAYQRL
jgi:putative NADH-flavin reductase